MIAPVRYRPAALQVRAQPSRRSARVEVGGRGPHEGDGRGDERGYLAGRHSGEVATAACTTLSTAPQKACCDAVVKIGWPVSSNSMPFISVEMYRPLVEICTRDAALDDVTRTVSLAVVATGVPLSLGDRWPNVQVNVHAHVRVHYPV